MASMLSNLVVSRLYSHPEYIVAARAQQREHYRQPSCLDHLSSGHFECMAKSIEQ